MKTYKVVLTKDFIKEAEDAACPEWKIKIRTLIPEAFEKQFVIGKWYKTKTKNNLCMFCAQTKQPSTDTGYGFNYKGIWVGSRFNIKGFGEPNKAENYEPATDKEVEEALIKEAKKRGLVEGAFVKSIYTGYIYTILREQFNFNYAHTEMEIKTKQGYVEIFREGKWAKPIENQTLKRIEEIEAELKQLKSKL